MTLDPNSPEYRDTIGSACYVLAGGGFPKTVIPDLGTKLDLFRAMAGLNPASWTDACLGSFMFGPTDPAGKISRKRNGSVAMMAADGAVLAQLLNRLAQLEPDRRRSYSSKVEKQLIAEMTTRPPGNSGLWATDLARPLHEFLGCAARAVAAAIPASGEDERSRNLDTVHDRLMAALNGLASRSDKSAPVRFISGRGAPRERFGDAQTPSALPVWEWPPAVLHAREQIIVDVPGEMQPGAELFGVTVRDPRPPAPGPRSGPYAWDEPWERLIRWSVPVGSSADGPEALRFGRVVDLPGLYSLFVLVDRAADGAARALIGGLEDGSVGIDAFYRLLAKAESGPLGVDCYVRRYRVDG